MTTRAAEHQHGGADAQFDFVSRAGISGSCGMIATGPHEWVDFSEAGRGLQKDGASLIRVGLIVAVPPHTLAILFGHHVMWSG